MHLGNLFSFMVAYVHAHQHGGYVVLRIDDLDQQRCKPEFVEQMIADLQWFGFTWEGPVVFQSKRTAAYQESFDLLVQNELVYPCFCTRADLHAASAPHSGEEFVYAGTCRKLSDKERTQRLSSSEAAWRIRVPDAELVVQDEFQSRCSLNLASEVGDFIVKRKDGAFAYQLATVVDDAFMGVTSVVRGVDLLTSSHRQRYLQTVLCLPTVQYAHIPLLVDEQGKRLAKRNNDASLAYLREQLGWTAEKILGFVAHKAGLIPSDEPASLSDLAGSADLTSLERVQDLIWKGIGE